MGGPCRIRGRSPDRRVPYCHGNWQRKPTSTRVPTPPTLGDQGRRIVISASRQAQRPPIAISIPNSAHDPQATVLGRNAAAPPAPRTRRIRRRPNSSVDSASRSETRAGPACGAASTPSETATHSEMADGYLKPSPHRVPALVDTTAITSKSPTARM